LREPLVTLTKQRQCTVEVEEPFGLRVASEPLLIERDRDLAASSLGRDARARD
jgi:hypothetical protein